MKWILTSLSFLVVYYLSAQKITTPEPTEVWEPEPKAVSISKGSGVPSDAIVLFDGTSLDAWKKRGGNEPAGWTLNGDGSMTVKPDAGDIQTKAVFGDVQLHLEFRTPATVASEGQGRGNSGVFFQQRYEVQILDSYQNRTYSNGQAGAVYKQYMPLVNASRPPGEWQTYDIIFQAPRFNADSIRVAPGHLTVLHNGVLIQNHVPIQGSTEYIGLPKNIAHGDDAILLQDHSNPVSYRNIWVRKI